MTPPLWMRLLRLYGKAFPVQRGKTRVANAVFRRMSVPQEPLIAKTFDGVKMELWPWLWADFATYCVGGAELFLLDAFRSFIREDSVVCDVGSYIGMFAFAAAPLASQGKIVAFEPDPRSARRLEVAIRSSNWRHVHLYQGAVGQSAGKLQLSLGSYPPQSSVQSGATPKDNGQVEVEETTLDDYCEQVGIKRVDLIKIDTEGAELNVLRGAARILAENQPILIVELHEEQSTHFGYTVADTVAFMRESAYDLFEVKPDWVRPRLRPFSLQQASGRAIVIALPGVSR